MAEAIRFLLNGVPRAVSDIDPNTTVLEYLRVTERLCGTKEGCAEGDCGACTVVLARPDGTGRLAYEPVNSCIQLLPTVDGKHLITVEGLKAADGSLHPVQRAMVEAHGSQCGFCTPGFVMSLFALWHRNKAPTREETLQALAGNLCRCTGYRPIIDAACATPDGSPSDQFDATADATATALAALGRDRGLAYFAGRNAFFAPRSLAELAEILRSYPNAVLLAGGTDLGLWITKQHRRFACIVSLGEVAELRRVERGATHLEIGAGASWSACADALAALHPSLEELLLRFASVQIRNAATIGGNIANASPIGDGPPPLIALGATVVLVGPQGEREVAVEDFFLAYRRTALRAGEIVARIRIPIPDPAMKFAVWKVSKRFDQDISAVCGAFALRFVDGHIASARIAFGGMAAIPARAKLAEAALAGEPWTLAAAQAAAAALDRDFVPITDMRASRDYRARVARNLLLRFYHETAGAAPETRVRAYG
ncbi:MAG TPA: xanthine dehydrogenase small subunit [Alphaproteobacteria bacterium]|nr:xanthine dehydrogenase small subunit [Alphaproteobacteria bacterium]